MFNIIHFIFIDFPVTECYTCSERGRGARICIGMEEKAVDGKRSKTSYISILLEENKTESENSKLFLIMFKKLEYFPQITQFQFSFEINFVTQVRGISSARIGEAEKILKLSEKKKKKVKDTF